MLGTWHGVSEEGMSATVIAKPQTDCEALKGGAADTLSSAPLAALRAGEQVGGKLSMPTRWGGVHRFQHRGQGLVEVC